MAVPVASMPAGSWWGGGGLKSSMSCCAMGCATRGAIRDELYMFLVLLSWPAGAHASTGHRARGHGAPTSVSAPWRLHRACFLGDGPEMINRRV